MQKNNNTNKNQESPQKMTMQQIYDKICLHLFVQNVKPRHTTVDENMRVFTQNGVTYRSPVAILLPFSILPSQINTKTLNQLFAEFKDYLPQDGATINFIEGIEIFYRDYRPHGDEHFKIVFDYLLNIGKKYKLDPSLIKSIPSMIDSNEIQKHRQEYLRLTQNEANKKTV